MDFSKLADLLLPYVNTTVKEIIEMYPKRQLPAGAKVIRFAPSPTGFIHMGNVYAALISEKLARQSGGVVYLRIEDTDRKREVKGSIPIILNSLDYFHISFDEGELMPGKETGSYRPYKQSDREHIYKAFVKELLRRGMAYPCFCSQEELNSIRSRQKTQKELTGYYGKWAACRSNTLDEIQKQLVCGKPFVIRLKSPGNPTERTVCSDLIKGEISFPENIQDIIILKSDGLPTYHFAHVVDDYLMGTTHVFRGDEWLSSVPVHLQLFEVLGWKPPFYGHISPIMKMDGTSKRKFSKRKDPEFAVTWYQQQGYPGAAVTEYFMGLVNSSFEEWRLKNPHTSYRDFNVTISKMSGSGALFDINKLNDVCRNVIAGFSTDEVYNALLVWSEKYDREFHILVFKYRDYTLKILNIGRGSAKPRKDFAKWSEIKPAIAYFYDELFNPCNETFDLSTIESNLPESVGITAAGEILNAYVNIYDEKDDNTAWFEKIKDLS